MLLLAVWVFATAVTIGGGVTKQTGLEQFWTDDFKVFEQVYGKTSDKEIYGATVPPIVNIGMDIKTKKRASEKKEKMPIYQDTDDFKPYESKNKFNVVKAAKKDKPKSSFNFVSNNDFRPISQSSDPETYNYLKRLEEFERERKKKLPNGSGSFKPYINNYFGPNPEETDAYQSIQDILDAHEANKGNGEAGSSKYLTYREKEKNKGNNKMKPSRGNGNKPNKPRCGPGRCRSMPPAPSYRPRPRPYYRTIKKVVRY